MKHIRNKREERIKFAIVFKNSFPIYLFIGIYFITVTEPMMYRLQRTPIGNVTM